MSLHRPVQTVEHPSAGYSLIEVIVVLVFSGVLAAIAGPMINSMFGTRPLDDSLNRVAGTLNLMRVKATSQTSAYRLRQGASSNVFVVEYANTCTATTWRPDGSFMVDDRTLGQGVTFSSVTPNPAITPWSVCFDNRGMADRSLDIRLAGNSGTQRRVQVFQGGSVQVY
jgi:prepilin-type N-terminal cleavage/methylation domain-containing protein